jgi:hypothetical protein
VVPVTAGEVRVADDAALRKAMQQAGPGDEIVLTGRDYEGGLWMENRSGTKERPIVVRGADPVRPPVIRGKGEGIHLSGCSHVELKHLTVDGATSNGINIDDGGKRDTPATGIIVRNVVVEHVGPRGNHDALKLSGLAAFLVEGCDFAGWGGSAIDMVGCRDGRVVSCRFTGLDGFSQSSGIQMKGGSRDIVVTRCDFRSAGERAVNLGGSTGLEYFRPEVGDFEARDIEVSHCLFIGGMCAIAHVGAIGGKVHHNTIVFPDKWVMRILQESTDDRFKPCQGGVWEDNLIVVDGKLGVPVNIGPKTDPDSFAFRNNVWHDTSGRFRAPGWPGRVENDILGAEAEVVLENGPEGLRPVIRCGDPRWKDKGRVETKP